MPKGLGKRQMVDKAFDLDRKIKELDVKLKPLKAKLKLIAETEKAETLVGHKAVATFGKTVTITIPQNALLRVLADIGKSDKLPLLTKVDNAATKKELGQELFDQIAERDETPYGKVGFKARG